jgi:hypothetical protein
MTGRAAIASVLAAFLLLPSLTLASDEPDELLEGKTGAVQALDHVKFLARDPMSPYDLPNASNNPTVEGGTVRFFDTGVGGDDETYALPAVNWSVDPMTGFYVYNATATTALPCIEVRVDDDRIEVRCVGAGVTLTPPFAGELGVILTIGTNSKVYCASMGGNTDANTTRKLERHNSPAPGACPTPPAPMPELLPGKVVVIKQATLAKFVARPPTGQTFDLPNNTTNPLTTGGTLRFRDTGVTGGDVTFSLPAGPKWAVTGKTGFKYRGLGQPGDACKVVIIKTRVIKGVCKGTDVTLNHAAFSGDVAVKLVIGSGPTKRYCAQYGGLDVSSATTLRRKDAPAPSVVDCPSPSGAFLDLGADLFE